MRHVFSALLAVTLVVGSARAHFIFLLPKADREGKPVVQAVFSDALAPDSPELLDRIKQTEVFVRGADGPDPAFWWGADPA